MPEHAVTLIPSRLQVLDIAIRNRVDDHVKALIFEREGQGHIGLQHQNLVVFTLCHHSLGLQLAHGVIQDGHAVAVRRHDRPLLPAATCQAQHVLTQPFEPAERNGPRGGENELDRTVFCLLELFGGQRNGPRVLIFAPGVPQAGVVGNVILHNRVLFHSVYYFAQSNQFVFCHPPAGVPEQRLFEAFDRLIAKPHFYFRPTLPDPGFRNGGFDRFI